MIETNEATTQVIEPDATGDQASAAGRSAPTTSKSDSVGKLLRRAKGATIVEMQEATAWQPHSVRAFLSGLRKKGSVLTKEQRKSGETAYRVLAKTAPSATADA